MRSPLPSGPRPTALLLHDPGARTRRLVGRVESEAIRQPDDSVGSWLWCWRQFARAMLASAPLGLPGRQRGHAEGVAEHQVGSWVWCWAAFVRGVWGLARRPRLRPELPHDDTSAPGGEINRSRQARADPQWQRLAKPAQSRDPPRAVRRGVTAAIERELGPELTR